MIRPKGTLVPPGPVVVPEPVLLMFTLGTSKLGWFNTLIVSTRNSNSLVSVILTRLIRLASNPSSAGPSIVFRPRLPICPGAGFTRTSRPWESTIALLLNVPLSPLSDDTLEADGSVTCWNPGKYVTPLDSLVTLPMFLGKSPTTIGVLLVVGVMFCQIDETGATTVNGGPEVQLKIAPNCQRSVR